MQCAFFGMVLALLSKWQRSSKEWIWFLPSIQFCSWFSSDFQIINLNPRWSQEVGIMQIQTSPPPPIPVNFLVPSLPPLSSSPPPPPPPSRWYASSSCYSMHCERPRRTLIYIHHIPVNSIQGFLNLTLSLSWVDQWSVTHPHFPLMDICPLPFLLTYLILSSRVETLSSLCQWWGDTKQVGDKSKLLFKIFLWRH